MPLVSVAYVNVRQVMDRTWTIAELAAEFGVTLRTLRHYEELGPAVPRAAGQQPGSTTSATGSGSS